MKSRLAQVGALTLAGGMLSLIIGHATLSGCHGPSESVATPSAEPVSQNKEVAATKEATPSPPSTAGTQPAAANPAPAPSVQVVVKPAPTAPVFMGASKAAPVFRGDQVNLQTPSTPSQASKPLSQQ